ncbi:MAG: DNA polymerase III subunit chi [Rhodospirillales bacterium]
MTDVAFYHLQRSRLDDVLPSLLTKTIDAGKRAVVIVGSEARVEQLDGALWAFDPASWLPHGSRRDGNPGEQPIWLTDADENPNRAEFLFLADGASSADVAAFERCFVLFDGNDDTAVAESRESWKAYKAAGHDVTYWKQGDRGWERQGE